MTPKEVKQIIDQLPEKGEIVTISSQDIKLLVEVSYFDYTTNTATITGTLIK